MLAQVLRLRWAHAGDPTGPPSKEWYADLLSSVYSPSAVYESHTVTALGPENIMAVWDSSNKLMASERQQVEYLRVCMPPDSPKPSVEIDTLLKVRAMRLSD